MAQTLKFFPVLGDLGIRGCGVAVEPPSDRGALCQQPVQVGEPRQGDAYVGIRSRDRVGETLWLVTGGRWLWPGNPLTGSYPARYRCAPSAACTLSWGPDRHAHLLIPRIPAAPV